MLDFAFYLLYNQEDVAKRASSFKKVLKKVDISFVIWYITNATEKEARNDLWKLSKKVKIWVLAIKLDLIWFI